LLVNVVVPCVMWTLMGLATFVAIDLSHVITLGFTNECVVPFHSPWQSALTRCS
jgi:hypothetical protein